MAQMEQVLWGEGSTPATSRAAVQPKGEKDSIAACCRCSPPRPSPPRKSPLPSKQRRIPAQRLRSPAKTLLLSPILLVLPSPLRPKQFRLPCRDGTDADFDGLDLAAQGVTVWTVHSFLFARVKNPGKERRVGVRPCFIACRLFKGEVIRYGHGSVAKESWLG